jgi:hypothetical protein
MIEYESVRMNNERAQRVRVEKRERRESDCYKIGASEKELMQ